MAESLKFMFYSLLSASTGSFLAAARAGIRPPIRVRIILKMIKIKALKGANVAFSGISPVK